jgi:hypothetical protein
VSSLLPAFAAVDAWLDDLFSQADEFDISTGLAGAFCKGQGHFFGITFLPGASEKKKHFLHDAETSS